MNNRVFRYSVGKIPLDMDRFDKKLCLDRFVRVELHGIDLNDQYVSFGFNVPIPDNETNDSLDDQMSFVIPTSIQINYTAVNKYTMHSRDLILELPCPFACTNNKQNHIS